MSSWEAHQHRNPRSQEPGTDFYCPIGTPVFAPADGVIYGYGNTIGPATGRWVGIQFQNGMSFRAMHFSRIERFSGVVKRGDLIGYSGASGYGVEDWSGNPNTGGAHTHVTLWPTAVRRYGYSPQTGEPYTIDFMNFVGGPQAAGGATTPPEEEKKDDDMKIIGNSTEGLKFVDELGADDMVQYYFTSGGFTFNQNIEASLLIAGAPEASEGPTLALVRHQANARWDQKRGQIVTDTVAALRPLFQEIASAVAGISPEKFASLIEAGLEEVVVKSDPISETDRAAIADAVRDRFKSEPLA